MIIRIKKGLDLPITGKPEQRVHVAKPIRHVGAFGVDHIDLKPAMLVAEGDKVKLGQALFEHKKLPGVRITAPGAGVVKAIHRGAQRLLQSVVIRLDETEDEETFAAYPADQLSSLTDTQVVANLLASGLWVALRTRPYSRIPDPTTRPAAIFVTAMDTNPLAADPVPIMAAEAESFGHGLTVLSRLGRMPIWVCTSPGADLPLPQGVDHIRQASFEGPHPAGLPGTHIHFLEPVDGSTVVWHLNYQEVIAIGKLFTSGRLWTRRIVALGGPQVTQPRLLQTRLGACLEELVEDELHAGESRIISGSILSGRHAADWSSYLGRHHLQISVIPEGVERTFMGWFAPGRRMFSQSNVMLSSLFRYRREEFGLNTGLNGSLRAMVPFGNFEDVMPLDILPTQLLRYLMVGDTDMAQKLGCMELDEEDLALCSFVCVGKNDYGPVLRNVLSQIEREG
ncbi:MAG: Na(+)-translocating NADH-quinone reductase subunit A [Nitrospira sp.]|nr:Na(+)-translocating NADH-quinone reductase subunit A [Nitrospira sp.]